MVKKVGIVSLGCPKNLVDSEIMLELLKNNQYIITADKSDADILIVNTCAFIETAKQESINTILELALCKHNGCELLIVTGCLAERYKNRILEEIPEVDAVLGTGNYTELADVIEKAYNGGKTVLYGNMGSLDYMENDRVVSTGKGFAYLKIAEGCDNCCTFCIIPTVRGRFRSRKMDDIVLEAAGLAKRGIKEVILVAQDTTRYGLDIYNKRCLAELVRKISAINGIEWIRLLYCYPEEVDSELIDELSSNEKLCKYLDIPVQHASDRILKAMGRRGDGSEVKDLIKRVRKRVPGIVIRTSLIVGFPGENENDFEQLCSFIKSMRFERLGVFMYSREEGTPASKLKEQISAGKKRKRYDAVMSLQKDISTATNRKRLNMVYRTLVEGISDDGIFYFGRTYAETPDIDGLVYFTSVKPLEQGEFVNVEILNIDEYDLIGEVKYESAQ